MNYTDKNGEEKEKIWAYNIVVEVTPEEVAKGKIDMEFTFNAKGSSSTNGIETYSYKYGTIYNTSGDETYTDTTNVSKVLIKDIAIAENGSLLDQQEIEVVLTVNDSVRTDVTAQSPVVNTIITFVKTKVPPKVDLECEKPRVVITTNQNFTVTYEENEDTFPITEKTYEIINPSTGEVIESGTGDIPSTVLIDEKYSDLGEFKATQTIYYEDKEGETHKISDTVTFVVIEPIPTAKIKATMVTELTNGIITKEKDITKMCS